MAKQYYVEDKITNRTEVLSLKAIIREIDMTDNEVDSIASMMVGDTVYIETYITIRREE